MSICCKFVRALAVVFLAACATPQQELTSSLYSTIYGAYVAFSNENVTFTCTARGSIGNHIGWSSGQYISAGGRRLEFISANPVGTTRISGDTVAVLVQAEENVIIESRLYIRILPTIPIASVQCHNIAAGTVTSITFRLANNDTSVVCDKPSVCSGEAVTCVCATANSNSLAWVTDGNRIEFTSNVPQGTRLNVTDSDAYGVLTNRYNENRVQVIASNLTLTASMDDTSLLAMCENVDRSTSNPVIISVTSIENCPAASTETTTSPGNEPASSDQSVGPIVGVAILAVLFVVLVVVCVVLAIIAIWKWTEISERDIKISKLENDKKTLNGTIAENEAAISKLNDTIDKKQSKILELNNTIGEKESTISKLNVMIGEKESTITKLATMISKKDIEMERLKREKTAAIEKIKGEMKTLITERDATIKELEGKITTLEQNERAMKLQLEERKSKGVGNPNEQSSYNPTNTYFQGSSQTSGHHLSSVTDPFSNSGSGSSHSRSGRGGHSNRPNGSN